MLRMGRHNVIPAGIMDVRVRAPASATPAWWAGAVVAYQPKGASSLEASYVNLANPGTYDAHVGTYAPAAGPALDAGGWVFEGAQYLECDAQPAVAWTILCQVSDIVANSHSNLFGFTTVSSTSKGIRVLTANMFAVGSTWDNAASFSWNQEPLTGNFAMAGQRAFYNGAWVGDINSGPKPLISGLAFVIGAAALDLAGYERVYFAKCKMQALVLYDRTLSDAEVATVASAMAAL